ncbi:uncharacterized protein [Palaemon carinicauda]|uniref:uncharacterized protein n=1 Tax=Palaemon carinicauda TaxID=392227 RepID=UPI0035B589AB
MQPQRVLPRRVKASSLDDVNGKFKISAARINIHELMGSTSLFMRRRIKIYLPTHLEPKTKLIPAHDNSSASLTLVDLENQQKNYRTRNSSFDLTRSNSFERSYVTERSSKTLVDLENQQKNYRTRKSSFDLTRSNSFERSYVTERSSKTLVDLENQQKNYRTRNSSFDLTRSNSFERSYVTERSSKAVLPFCQEVNPTNGTQKPHRFPQSILRLPQNIP